MIITAKFAAVCPCCSKSIEVGSKIEWSKGEKAKHTGCAGKATTKSAPRAASYSARRPYAARGASYERGTGMVCDECGERATPGSRCWETGAAH